MLGLPLWDCDYLDWRKNTNGLLTARASHGASLTSDNKIWMTGGTGCPESSLKGNQTWRWDLCPKILSVGGSESSVFDILAFLALANHVLCHIIVAFCGTFPFFDRKDLFWRNVPGQILFQTVSDLFFRSYLLEKAVESRASHNNESWRDDGFPNFSQIELIKLVVFVRLIWENFGQLSSLLDSFLWLALVES